jgi:purine-nucleoside phosphorylase
MGQQAPTLAEAVREAAEAVRRRCQARPLIGLVLGSGLGRLAEHVESPCAIPFGDIPHHPQATVRGHLGDVVFGSLEGVSVGVWRGRVHYYEGGSMAAVAFPIRLLHALGGRAVVLTNAAGGLNESFRPGDLMVVVDHISLASMVGHSPLRGTEQSEGNDCFVDLSEAYDAELRDIATRAADAAGFGLWQGVYAMVAGPHYETPAEARLLRRLGADAVGMSTVPEVIVARQLGMRVAAISAITNVLLGRRARASPSHTAVLQVAERAEPRLTSLVAGMLPTVAKVLQQ